MSSAASFQNMSLKNSSRHFIRLSNGLNPDQARRFVGPDLILNCLQDFQQTTKIADGRQSVNLLFVVVPMCVKFLCWALVLWCGP